MARVPVLHIPMDPEHYAEIVRQARKSGMKVKDYARFRLLQAVLDTVTASEYPSGDHPKEG